MSGTIMVSHVKITGGNIDIDPEFHHFNNCYFTGVDIRMTVLKDDVFVGCYFLDCKLDQIASDSVLMGWHNMVYTTPKEAAGDATW